MRVHLIVYGCLTCPLTSLYTAKSSLWGMQIEKSRGDKGSFASSMPSMGSSRFDNGFGDTNSSIGGSVRPNSSGFGSGLDTDVFKPKGVFIRPYRIYLLVWLLAIHCS